MKAFILTILFSSSPLIADKLPTQFKLKGMSGNELTRDDLKNKPTIFQFWASWCKGCTKAMKKVSKWKFSKKTHFAALSIDDDMDSAHSYFNTRKRFLKKITKQMYFDEGSMVAESIGITQLPMTIVVDSKGKVLHKIEGPPQRKDYRKLKKLLKKNS